MADATRGGNCAVGGGSGLIVSGGGNLEDANTCGFGQPTDIPSGTADLGNLEDNGGPTRTHALGENSDAIDNADAESCLQNDQRGAARSDCDIGSFERGGANVVPVAVGDAFATDEDQTLIVPVPGVLVNDDDTDGDPLEAIIEDAPQNGDVVLREDGSFEYTPDAGFSGMDTFTYRATDGYEQSDAATVTITVNRAPNPDPDNPDRCTITGTRGDDALRGTPRRDVICGLGGDDAISGMDGSDVLKGGPGDDVLKGGRGDDELFGGNGDDILEGDAGRDRLDGGPGKDRQRQ